MLPFSKHGFATTQWSLILRGAERSQPGADDALADLSKRYWFPLYAFIRRRVGDAHRAQDLTQDFFAFLLEKNVLARAAPDRGRFRNFLLAAAQNFLNNERDRAATRKRGGGIPHLSLDWLAGEARLNLEPVDRFTPERLFERQWALTVLDLAVAQLRDEFEGSGKGRQFEVLKATLTGERGNASYAQSAEDLGITEQAARQAAYRLRQRYRELLREEVARSLADPADIDGEIASLFAALSR